HAPVTPGRPDRRGDEPERSSLPEGPSASSVPLAVPEGWRTLRTRAKRRKPSRLEVGGDSDADLRPTASPRKWLTSSAASVTTDRRYVSARMARPCWRSSSPPTPPRRKDGASTYRSPRTQPDRSTCGGRRSDWWRRAKTGLP